MGLINAKELLLNKTKLEARQNQIVDIEVRGLGGVCRFRVPTMEEIVDAQVQFRGTGANHTGVLDEIMIYNQCIEPNLRDIELAQAFLNQSYADYNIVGKLLLAGEIKHIASALMDKAGYDDNNIDVKQALVEEGAEEIKN